MSVEPDTSTTTAPAPASTTTSAVAGDSQAVTYGGLRLLVPAGWPLHDLAHEPTACVRADQHAVFLGTQGANASCPAQIFGRTEAVQLESLATAPPGDSDRATQTTVLNGLNARVDPDPKTNGALTAVFPDQGVVLIITYRDSLTLAQQILGSVTAA